MRGRIFGLQEVDPELRKRKDELNMLVGEWDSLPLVEFAERNASALIGIASLPGVLARRESRDLALVGTEARQPSTQDLADRMLDGGVEPGRDLQTARYQRLVTKVLRKRLQGLDPYGEFFSAFDAALNGAEQDLRNFCAWVIDEARRSIREDASGGSWRSAESDANVELRLVVATQDQPVAVDTHAVFVMVFGHDEGERRKTAQWLVHGADDGSKKVDDGWDRQPEYSGYRTRGLLRLSSSQPEEEQGFIVLPPNKLNILTMSVVAPVPCEPQKNCRTKRTIQVAVRLLSRQHDWMATAVVESPTFSWVARTTSMQR